MITTCSNIQVMKIKKTITKDEMTIFRHILVTRFVRNVWRTVRRVCINIRAERVKKA